MKTITYILNAILLVGFAFLAVRPSTALADRRYEEDRRIEERRRWDELHRHPHPVVIAPAAVVVAPPIPTPGISIVLPMLEPKP